MSGGLELRAHSDGSGSGYSLSTVSLDCSSILPLVLAGWGEKAQDTLDLGGMDVETGLGPD